jgi:hypothetical protein
VTLDRSDRDGLRLQVHAGRDPLTGRKRWVSRPVPGKGRAAMKRAKQVEAELLVRVAAGQYRGSRPKTVAELIEQWLEGRKSVRPISPTTIAAYRGDIDRSMCRATPRSRSRPAGAATLDTFYVRLRKEGGGAGRRLLPTDQETRSRGGRGWLPEFGLRHVAGGVGSIGHRIPPRRLWK